MEKPKVFKTIEEYNAYKSPEKAKMMADLKKKMETLMRSITQLRKRKVGLEKKKERPVETLATINKNLEEKTRIYNEYDRNLKMLQRSMNVSGSEKAKKEPEKKGRKIDILTDNLQREQKTINSLKEQRSKLKGTTDAISASALSVISKKIEAAKSEIDSLNDQILIEKDPSKKILILNRRGMITLFNEFKKIKKAQEEKIKALENYKKGLNDPKDKQNIGNLSKKIESIDKDLDMSKEKEQAIGKKMLSFGLIDLDDKMKVINTISTKLFTFKDNFIEEIYKPYLEGKNESWKETLAEGIRAEKEKMGIEKFQKRTETQKEISGEGKKKAAKIEVEKKEEISNKNLSNLAKLIEAKAEEEKNRKKAA